MSAGQDAPSTAFIKGYASNAFQGRAGRGRKGWVLLWNIELLQWIRISKKTKKKQMEFAAHKDKHMLRPYSPTVSCFCLESNWSEMNFIKEKFKNKKPHQAIREMCLSKRWWEENLLSVKNSFFSRQQIGVSVWQKDDYLRLLIWQTLNWENWKSHVQRCAKDPESL